MDGTTKSGWRRKHHLVNSSWMFLLLAVILSSCFIDRSGLAWEWENDVRPGNVCPGEFVTVSWNTGETRGGCLSGCSFGSCSGCPDPIRVSISSSPHVMAAVFTYEQNSSLPAGPINETTTFSFSARDDDDDLAPSEHMVNVILPERETYVPAEFEGTCSGDRAAWEDVSMAAGDFRSELVRLVHACNLRNGFTIGLTLTFETSIVVSTLLPGMCTRDFSTEEGFEVLSARATTMDPGVLAGVACTTIGSYPPDIVVDMLLACDLETTSEPIVAAPPTPSEEGETVIITNTPTPPLVSIATFTPTPIPSLPMARLIQNANCRRGPGTVYGVVTSLLEGQEVNVEGQNASSLKWWWILLPESTAHCWVTGTSVDTFGPVEMVQVMAAPPSPTPTLTPVQGCWHQGPNDNQQVCYSPCPDNPNPGGACTP